MPAKGSVNALHTQRSKKRNVGTYVIAIDRSAITEIKITLCETAPAMKAHIPATGDINIMASPSTVPNSANHEHRNCVNAVRATIFQTSRSLR